MRILLDESLPHALRLRIPGHEVVTVRYQGWAGKKNGELLRLAETEGFDAMMTGDQSIHYQQDFRNRTIALLVLGTNDWPSIEQALPAVNAAVASLTPGTITFPDIPDFVDSR